LLNRVYFETYSFPVTVTLQFPPPSWGRVRVLSITHKPVTNADTLAAFATSEVH